MTLIPFTIIWMRNSKYIKIKLEMGKKEPLYLLSKLLYSDVLFQILRILELPYLKEILASLFSWKPDILCLVLITLYRYVLPLF